MSMQQLDITLAKKKQAKLHRHRRLLQQDVVKLLQDGARLVHGEFAIKIRANNSRRGRIAIAVPKRILKSAVDRNRVKRVIREEFRLHTIRSLPVDLLVTLRSKAIIVPPASRSLRREKQKLRESLAQLWVDIFRRFGVAIH
jgi:ribonuclease P protein component